MTKLFIAKPFDSTSRVGLIDLYYRVSSSGNTIFTNKLPRDFCLKEISIVENINESDYVLVPQAIRNVTPEIKKYLSEVKNEALKYKKRIIVFVGGDLSHNVFIDDVIVLKGSQYGYLKRSNEIIVPPFSEDLGEECGVSWRVKNGKPVIGFCGWAGFSSLKQYFKYRIKILMCDVLSKSHIQPLAELHKKGLYFRRKAMRILRNSNLVVPNFITRKTFSANSTTISIDPHIARKEYVDVLLNSDFILAPKGDGNFSVRFYEALSLGRIPILIDTDCVLPLSEKIDYDLFIVRVPYTQINNTPQIVSDLFQRLSNTEFIEMQQRARFAYEKYLRYDSFFNELFSDPENLNVPKNEFITI